MSQPLLLLGSVMRHAIYFVPFAMLVGCGLQGCSPMNGRQDVTSRETDSEPRPLLNGHDDTEFVWIPPSGEEWHAECDARGLPYAPVDGFYFQRRPLSLTQFRDLGGDVEGYSSLHDVDWNQSATVPSWVEGVNLGYALSTVDLELDYRLPTTNEWLYAYSYAKKQAGLGRSRLDFSEVTNGGFEFATDTLLSIQLPVGYEASHASETASHSFVMGRPYGFGPEKPNTEVMANRTPPTGDDGIDEQTFVRFVLVPKNRPEE